MDEEATRFGRDNLSLPVYLLYQLSVYCIISHRHIAEIKAKYSRSSIPLKLTFGGAEVGVFIIEAYRKAAVAGMGADTHFHPHRYR